MTRIAGIDLPNEKRLDIALTYLYGIGRQNVKTLLEKAGVDGAIRMKVLSEDDIGKIQKILDKEYKIEGNLRSEIAGNIKRLREIGCYRGIRHARGLPVHGQRTRSNARTKRGKRQTVGAMKKDTRAKLEQGAAAKPAEKK